ncbi:CBS domain-containing protein, partial [Agrobacterium sp. SHOUNA12C]|nr:CBS domain-containing protein [Agrobacterium sp. SHOUNA12C]
GFVLPGDPGFWALLGMAAMMGGTMRAPLTGTFFAIELTGDMQALVPLLAATVAAYAVTVLLLKRSILTEKIARRGQHITREYGIDPFELTRVADIMIAKVDTLPATMPAGEALAQLTEKMDAHRFYPIVEADGRLVGMISRADALRWQHGTDLAGQTLYDLISDTSIPVAHPQDTVGRVADIMIQADTGRVPVVDERTGVLIGLIARKDLLRLRSAANRSEFERGAYLGAKR